MRKNISIRRILFVLVLVFAALYFFAPQQAEGPEELTYGKFFVALEAGQIESVIMYGNQDWLEGEYIAGHANAVEDAPDFEFEYLGESEDEIDAMIRGAGVDLKVENPKQNIFVSMLIGFLPIILILGLLFWYLKSQGSGGMLGKFSGSKARKVDRPKTKFTDVAGIEEVAEQLEEIVQYLKNPSEFADWGIEASKGVLLYGEPGTGKTLLARAIAGEAGVPFYEISGSDFVEMFVGVGASRVRKMFEEVKAAAPAILFIDEIDAVGRHRGAGLGGGHDEREQTLNQMLVELDGFEENTGVIVIAATNRPDILDPALLRSGRFDLKLAVPKPDRDGRIQILDVHIRGKKRVELSDEDKQLIGKRTMGLVGADIEAIVNKALKVARWRALRNLELNKLTATVEDFFEAVDIVQMGPERRGRKMSPEDILLTAVHESGHALVSMLSPRGHPVEKLTIIPRGMAGGFTLPLPEEESSYAQKSELLDSLSMSVAGRVAEDLYLGDISTGASNDFEKATEAAKNMVKRWGMSEAFPYRVYGGDDAQPNLGLTLGGHRDWSDSVAEKLDMEINRFLDNAGAEAKEILSAYGVNSKSGAFQALVHLLIEEETLHYSQIVEALDPWLVWSDEEVTSDGGEIEIVRTYARWTRDDEGALAAPSAAVAA